MDLTADLTFDHGSTLVRLSDLDFLTREWILQAIDLVHIRLSNQRLMSSPKLHLEKVCTGRCAPYFLPEFALFRQGP
jgi:hypothetical protein